MSEIKKYGIDSISTPIIMSSADSEGHIVYKNKSAVCSIKVPLRGASVRARLSSENTVKYDGVLLSSQPDIISLSLDGAFRRALVFRYEYGGEPVLAWVFPMQLQQSVLSPFTDWLAINPSLLAENFIGFFDELAESDKLRFDHSAKLRLTRLDEHINGIVNSLYGDRFNIYNQKEFYLLSAIASIDHAIIKDIPKYGYRIQIKYDSVPPELKIGDFGRVVTSIFYVFMIAFSASSNKTILVNLYPSPFENISEQRYLYTDIVFTLGKNNPHPQSGSCVSGSMLDFAQYYPDGYIELDILSQLTLYRHWTSGFTITGESQKNCTIHIAMDIKADNIVFASPKYNMCENMGIDDHIGKICNMLFGIYSEIGENEI